MTAEAQLALIEAIPKIFTALGALIVIVLGALGTLIIAIWQASRNAGMTERKLEQIHISTNSNLERITDKWETQTQVVRELENTIRILIAREAERAPQHAKVEELIERVTESDELKNGTLAQVMQELARFDKQFTEMQNIVNTLAEATK